MRFRKLFTFLIVAIMLGTLVHPAAAQPAARRLSFADAAAAVLQANLRLRAAAFDVAVAEAQLAQARGARLPQATVSASYTRFGDRPGQTLTIPNPFGPTPPVITFTLPPLDPNQFLARLTLQFPLYTGGRLESQIAMAEANLRGAQAVFERTKEQTLFTARSNYLQILLAQENAAAALRARDQAQESLRIAQARLQTGAAPQFDVLQAEVAVAGAEQAIVRADTGVQSARTDLTAALNVQLDLPLDLTDTLAPQPVSGTLADAIAQAALDRPDLIEVRSRLEAARAGIELAASGGRPSLTVSAGYDVSGNATSSLTGAWFVALGVTLSIFDGGITRERIREATLRVEQLTVLGAETKQRVEVEVRQAWLALQQANGELIPATRAVEQGREAARLATVRYEAGVGTSLEVISAQAALAQADVALASARFGHHVARNRLLLATGAL
ncbi:MAG: TolC family protein [Armatimonadota bacterium]